MAFRSTLAALGAQVREAQVDHEAFQRPMRRCELARCRATCCHDGVVLGPEEAEGITALVEVHRGTFDAYGWSAGDGAAVECRDGKWRTVTRPAGDAELAADFPPHFARTRCVFLDPQHRCVLQRLATDAGRHPWFWKPVSCWMHPVLVRTARPGARPVITVRAPDDDAARFATCTHCGRPEPDGEPAASVLRAELELLGQLGGRNLQRELE